jgi:hypothetical protein
MGDLDDVADVADCVGGDGGMLEAVAGGLAARPAEHDV